jgi:PBP1b-binding outer membrane lipoprotein LpoB
MKQIALALVMAAVLAGCSATATLPPSPTASPTAQPTPTVKAAPTIDVELQAAGTHVARAIDQIEQIMHGLGTGASTSAIVASFRQEKTVATDTADWIEAQPIRIQDNATIAKAHDHFRALALHVQAVFDGVELGDTSGGDAKAVGTEIANLTFMRPDLEALK